MYTDAEIREKQQLARAAGLSGILRSVCCA